MTGGQDAHTPSHSTVTKTPPPPHPPLRTFAVFPFSQECQRGVLVYTVMPLRHVVLGKFIEAATAEQKQTMFDHLKSLPEAIPEIMALEVGEDLGLSEGNFGFALNVEFASAEDYKVYATHPAHVKVITDFIKPILLPGSRSACQFALADVATTSANKKPRGN